MTDLEKALSLLKEKSNKTVIASQQRFGIDAKFSIGVKVPDIRNIAKAFKNNHTLALQLWESKIHEARILATMIDDPKQVTKAQVKQWIGDLYSWDVTDGLCGNLLVNVPWVYNNLESYCKSKQEFTKRTGFVLMAYSAVHHKQKSDNEIESYLPLIYTYADDERNFVKKAVSWALRQIGKRNNHLKKSALTIAQQLLTQNTKATCWIAKDVIKELSNKTT
jgi:3-methyladenine DNA glycosylase AlkD